ncbi:MAG TPA: SPFH domain-containing protein [Rhodanobacteraceae bacterium]|jgi:regulator of protease activity HflC (stomatin/prohibitin superfamily)|nr:SPFH domain-containing protein [Rhodanobacteraceae bacterium]
MIAPITIFALFGIAALLVGASVKRIPEGHVYTLRRWGRPQPRMLLPGTHMVLPLIERIAHKISLGGHTLRLDEALPADAAITRALHGSVYWQVLEPERADAVIERADELIRARTLQALQVAADEDERARNVRLKQVLNAELRARGMLVTRVDLQLA